MKNYKIILVAFVLVASYGLGIAQNIKYNVGDSTKMTVTGTSTLHDWTSEVNTVSGYVETSDKFITKGKIKKGEKIHAVHIVVPVKSIISPRGATMDNKTYDALKSEENPDIIFDLKHNEITVSDDMAFMVNCKGTLTMAGVTNEIEFPVSGLVVSDNEMHFTGAYKLNMTHWKMEPPSAMFGQIVTGEEVEIKFELVVTK